MCTIVRAAKLCSILNFPLLQQLLWKNTKQHVTDIWVESERICESAAQGCAMVTSKSLPKWAKVAMEQVYLASKKDTREVCALKVMSKKLLFKLDEVRHILTERDILTAAKSEWLVKLLYAFQDEKSIYLAMVCSWQYLA